ncbi:MAG: large subunit ribosomal protein [Solirubrobacterales bacterium]|jgi:ribosomal protein L22|nr:large subunit ribosomal protein [Solirubrobacterales bacterium]
MAERKNQEGGKKAAEGKEKPVAKKAEEKPKAAAKPTPDKGTEAAQTKAAAKAVEKAKPDAAKAKGEPKSKPKAEAKAKPAAKRRAKSEAAKPKPAAKPKATEKAATPVPPTVRASARYVRVAPRKARLVADQIRGKGIEDARALLRFSPRGAAVDLAKLLDSAAANAEHNHDLVAEDLEVAEIQVNDGPTLRRFRPRARGSASRINKRTCHVSVALRPKDTVS